MSIVAAVVLVGVGLVVVLAVSGDDDYCTVLEEKFATIEGMYSGAGEFDETRTAEAVEAIHELRDAAPDEVADEWELYDKPFRDLEAALDSVGVSLSEAVAADSPDDLPADAVGAIETFYQELSAIDQSTIDQTLNDHAKDECGLNLDEVGASSGA